MDAKEIIKLAVERRRSRNDFHEKYLLSKEPGLIYRRDISSEVDALLLIDEVVEMKWEGKILEGTGEWFNGGYGLEKYRRSVKEYEEVKLGN